MLRSDQNVFVSVRVGEGVVHVVQITRDCLQMSCSLVFVVRCTNERLVRTPGLRTIFPTASTKLEFA